MRRAMLVAAMVIGMTTVPGFASDNTFVTKAAQGGMAEVELGNMAAGKGTTDVVKQFGRRMADDHAKANEELKTLASKKGITLPAQLSAEDKALEARLMKLSGTSFDRAYMKAMVDDHVKDVAEFRTESQSAADPEIKAWAAKTLPTLEEHLRIARETNGAVGTSARK